MQRLSLVALGFAALLGGASGALAASVTFPVPTATIYAGDVIKPSMLREQAYPENYQPQTPAVESIEAATGRVARRTLLPGTTIPVTALDEARLVTRGAQTQIVFEEQGMTIATLGVALANGGLNEVVRVRNAATGRIVQGIVQADGRVRTGGP